MLINGCARCGQLVFFENTVCLRCGAPLGFAPSRSRVITLVAEPARSSGPGGRAGSGVSDGPGDGAPAGVAADAEIFLEILPVADVAAALATGDSDAAGAQAASGSLPPVEASSAPAVVDLVDERSGRYRRCANAVIANCNWLLDVPPGEEGVGRAAGGLCLCCRLTRTRPADSDPVGGEQFERAEAAKRRLVRQLLELGLPVVSHADDPAHGLAFDLLSSTEQKVVTGHSDGVITLDLAESDDAHRESVRAQLGEPYRTLLGHFRHEVGHYYWTLLVGADERRSAEFAALFGDPDSDYSAALQRHYRDGPPADWRTSFVSAYATMHPWEDWAETFAHYLHIRDTLLTAAEFGIRVAGPDLGRFGVLPGRLTAEPARVVPPGDSVGGGETAESAGPADSDGQPVGDAVTARPSAGGPIALTEIIAQWLPLTYALNAMNRSMGKDDLYPFVLTRAVQEKLAFVHELVTAAVPRSEARVA